MNTNSKRLGLYLIAMLFLTAAATVLRTAACIMDVDFSSGFFTNKSLITAANIIITFTATGVFSYLFIAPRINLRASFSTSTTYVPTGVLGVATAFLGAKIFSYASTVKLYPIFPEEMVYMESAANFIGIAAAILAFVSIVHHFLNAFIVESKAETRAYFAMASVVYLALYSMLIYLDPTLSVGESSKVLRLTAFLLAALFFLYEARISLGREMWRIYTAFGLASASICAYTSIPAIITYFIKDQLVSYSEAYSLVSIEEYLLLFALFIFIVARLFITVTLQEEKENVYLKALANYANEREQKVAESFARHQKTFASKQLSIFDLYGGEIQVDEEESEETDEETEVVEEVEDPTISDDAIYEAIFGRMPERDENNESREPKNPEERVPEEIANELLDALDEVMNKMKEVNDKETEL